MRLIDADVLMEEIKMDIADDGLTESLTFYRIMNAPTIDAVSVVHGEWIKSETDGFICSACGSGYRNQPTCMGKPMFEYCPICGAKMDGEREGE